MDEPTGWSYVEGAAHPAWCLDRALRYRRVNGAWEARARERRAPGASERSEPLGRSYLDDLEEAARDRWAPVLGEIVGGRLGHYAEAAVEAGLGGERRVLVTAGPTLGPDARPDGVLMASYDVTDAALAARDRERHAQVMQTARRLQHFLGNQLALTMGYVELLTIDPRLPEELRERVEEALRGVVEATESLTYLRRLARDEIAPDDPAIEAYLGGEHG